MNTPPSKTLLLVSSTPSIISQIEGLIAELPKSSYDLFKETNPEAALRKCLPNLEVNAVLMDLSGDSGPHIQFLQTLRQHYPSVPVVGLVPNDDEISQIEFLAHGIQECLGLAGLSAKRFSRVIRFARARVASSAKDDNERRYLNALLETIPDNIYFKDRDGNYLRVSKSMANALGKSSYKELIGRSDSEFFKESHVRHAFLDEQQVMRTGEPIVGKLEQEVARDGRQSWKSTTRMPLFDSIGNTVGTLGISRDVTDMVATEQALERERLFLHTILDSIQDSIFVKDAEGRYLLSNHAHARSIGAGNPNEIIGKTVFDFFPEDFARPFHESDIELLKSGEVVLQKEERRKTASGQTGWFLTSKIPFRNPKTGEIGIVGISRDITKRKNLEAQLGEQS